MEDRIRSNIIFSQQTKYSNSVQLPKFTIYRDCFQFKKKLYFIKISIISNFIQLRYNYIYTVKKKQSIILQRCDAFIFNFINTKVRRSSI